MRINFTVYLKTERLCLHLDIKETSKKMYKIFVAVTVGINFSINIQTI